MPLPPLVEPGPPLEENEAERLARHVLLPQLGEIGQRRLAAARVCVLGAGGLGAPALLYLAAAGIGTLGIVDHDRVDLTNLQRQVIHGQADIGQLKVDSAAASLAALAPTRVISHPVRLTAQNAAQLLAGYDIVLDGTDNFDTRYLVSDVCAKLGKPLVWASVLQFDAQVSVFWSRPPGGRAGLTLRDLFPEPPAPGTVPACSDAGVLGALCGQVGSLMANEAIKLVAGIGEPLLGRVLVIDSLAATFSEVPLRPRPGPPQAPPATSSAPARPLPWAQPPAGVPHLTVAELVTRLDARERGADDFTLIDVRTEVERHTQGAIPGDDLLLPLPLAVTEVGRSGLDPARPVILYCSVGPRAERAALAFAAAGFSTAVLTGGINDWRRQ